ncbi:hypothetical protein AB0K60_29910 [Thermopolyspora sp. NPDC052614]|uniref:hypothetical protein n=1 Tax=Thermopolyspora sp. NPDC052614 TaxID=3155682 RepID=UPI00342785D2
MLDLPPLPGYGRYQHTYADPLTRAPLLVRSIVERDYPCVRHLADLMRAKPSTAGHTTYIGLEPPDDLPRPPRSTPPRPYTSGPRLIPPPRRDHGTGFLLLLPAKPPLVLPPSSPPDLVATQP